MNNIAPKRTIEDVLNLETGEPVKSSDFFKKTDAEIHRTRINQERAIQGFETNDVLVCYYCKQIIKIKGKPEGKGKKIKYFSHFADTNECHIKTNGKYSKEEVQRIKYNGAKESILHISLKEFIANALEDAKANGQPIEDIKIEKIFKEQAISKEWKKPDVQCKYFEKRLVFELQLSTTFLSVIVQREEFYKEHKTFILWVFRNFDLNEDLQKFTQKDIIYSNNRNAFVLTDKAKELSAKNKELTLLCHYQIPKILSETVNYVWEHKYVTLSELTYDSNNFRIYYYDSDKRFQQLEQELRDRVEKARIAAQKAQEEREKEGRRHRIQNDLEPILLLFREFRENDIEKLELIRQIKYLDKEELEILGDVLENEFGNDQPFWYSLLQTPKSNFTSFVLRHEEIQLNCEYKIDDITAFQYIASIDLEPKFLGNIYLNFLRKGYKSTSSDEIWIKEKVRKYTELNKQELERVVLFKYIWQLKSPELVKEILEITHIIFPLVSFKLGMVLGSELKNLISVANNFLEYRKEYIELMISALKLKDTEGVLKRESFQKKLDIYYRNPIEQKTDYDEVLALILPELKRK